MNRNGGTKDVHFKVVEFILVHLSEKNIYHHAKVLNTPTVLHDEVSSNNKEKTEQVYIKWTIQQTRDWVQLNNCEKCVKSVRT